MSGKDRHHKRRCEEYWGKRPMSSTDISHRPGVNKRTKQITHHIERQRGKAQLRRDGWDG